MGSIARWYEFAELFAFCDLHASRARSWQFDLRINEETRDDVSYYDRQGFPIPSDGIDPPTLVWARMRKHGDYAIVAVDQLPDGSRLSTVWLGLDHGFGGRPLIFETMRFRAGFSSMEFPDPCGEPGDLIEQLRYTTEEEALAAHHEIVRRIVVREGH